jgi:NurA-like 5'-3' nuclease
MGSHVFWTKRQIELVEETIKAIEQGYPNPLKHAADVVKMSYRTARNTLYRMRNRHDAMERSLEQYASWRRRMKGRRRYL